MTDLLTDTRFWMVVCWLALGAVGLYAARRDRRLELIGLIRQRCEICEEALAEPSTDDDLDLCPDCRRQLDEEEQRHAESEVLR